MDARIDVPGGAALIETVGIDQLVGPFRWVKWVNVVLLYWAVTSTVEMIFSALRREFDFFSVVLSLMLVFPSWIAWKNINVVNSLNQRYTIRSLLFVGVPLVTLYLGDLLISGRWGIKGDSVFILLGSGIILIGGIIALLAALAVWRLRHRVIDPLGVKLVDLLSSLSKQRAPGRLRNVRPQRPLLGLTLIATAVVVLVFDKLIPEDRFGTAIQYISQFGFCLILLARSAFQSSANTVLEADDRKPVLLLRSFIDDERLNWQRSQSSFVDTSLESRLTSHFSHYGPFIAVGSPSEEMPVIGASRIRLFDYEWQDQVIRWIDDSRTILVMVGVTDWIDWELKQVIAHNALSKLIICFPEVGYRKWKDKSLCKFSVNMETRLNRLRQAFAETSWSVALGRLDDAKSLRSLIFREGGGVTIVRARSRDRNAYNLAVVVAHWIICTGWPVAANDPVSATTPSKESSKTDRWFASVPLLLLGASALIVGFDQSLTAVLIPMALGLLLAGLTFNPALPRCIRHFVSEGRRLWVSCGLAAALFGYGALVFCATGTDRGWSQLAADTGHADAMAHLGWLYYKGLGVTQDYGQARGWFQKAANGGISDAMNGLGLLYDNGLGVAQDYVKASEWYQKAAGAGDTDAMAQLGVVYQKGLGVPKDYVKASECFQKASHAGNTNATYNLGALYYNGLGVAQDYVKASEWFQKAANDGHANAMHSLGVLYQNGWAIGISPDGHWLVTGSADQTARLWDLMAQDPAANPVVLRGHEGTVWAVGISPDNHWMLTGSQDQTARLWPLQVNDLIELARVTVGRNFSVDEWQLYFSGQPYHQTFVEYQGQTTKYASIPNMATEFQHHIGQDNAKNFFSHLTPAKKLELIKRNIQNVFIPTARSLRTSPETKEVRMRYSLEGQSLIDDYAYEFSTPLQLGTIVEAKGVDPGYVGQ